MRCWICDRVIVSHDDVWVEVTTTVHGDGPDRSISMSACNDQKCVASSYISMSQSVVPR